jgi:macrolide transport system ATP-binding/permease protein
MDARLPRLLELLVRWGVFQVSEAELGDILEDYSRSRSRWWLWMQIFSLARRATMFSNLRGDVRYGIRSLSRSPGFALAAILTIALGIGINTGIFSILNSMALRPLRVPDSDNLVTIYQQFRGVQIRNMSGARSMFSTPEYRNYRDRTQTLSGVMGFAVSSNVTLGGNYPRDAEGILVTCNYFEVLQVRPVRGPGFTGANCDAPDAGPVVVVSHELWTADLGADPDIVGKSVVLNRQAFAVVGVAPENFHGTEALKASFFIPLSMQPVLLAGRDNNANEHLSWLTLIGRMKDGIGIERVRADLGLIAGQIDQQQPGRTTSLIISRASGFSLPEGRTTLLTIATVIMTAFGLVLLIACANVANLLLARSAGRSGEIAVRLSLGATRGRLIQQLLTESVLIAIAGGLLGSVLTLWSFRGLMAVVLSALPAQLPPIAMDANPDLRVLWFALALTLATGVFFGLVPALQATRTDLHSTLKQDSAGSGRRTTGLLRAGLVGIQVAVCMVLVISAGLLVRGLHAAQTVDPGFDYRDVTVVSFDLSRAGYDDAKAAAFQRQFIERTRALSEAGGVALAGRTPLWPGRTGTMVRLPGQEQRHQMEFNSVSPDYFSVIRLPVVRGRNFTDADMQDTSRTVIVTEATAARYWPDQEPVGQTLYLGVGGADWMPLEVIGVAKDAQITRIAETASNYMYLPAAPRTQRGRQQLLVRSRMDLASTASAVRAFARDLDPGLVVRVNRLEENLEFWRTMSRLATSLSASLGGLALLIASIGVYGVVSYVVSRRQREVGIRMVLGATGAEVQRMIVRQTLLPVVIGMLAGIAGAAAVSRVLEAVLFGISAFDPIAFVVPPLFVLVIAGAASVLPARKTTRVDPMSTLRYE